MSVRIHAAIVVGLPVLSFVILFAAFILGFLLDYESSQLGAIVLASIPVLFLASFAFLHLVPAHCNKPQCHGRARPTWIRTSRFREALWYRCDVCHATYNAKMSMTYGEH